LSEFLLTNEPIIRLSAFLGILVVMMIWEVASPCRRLEIPRLIRWSNNLGIVAVNTIVVRLTFPIVAVGLALHAESQNWGLFNLIELPMWLAIVISVVLLDLVIYLQHVMVHAIPILWRLHRLHHADLDYDVTTGLRFHPFEIILSMAIKLVVIFALGPPAAAVLIFEVLLNGTAMFNHGNVRLPLVLDKVLRWIVVTPDMHRVHHSVRPEEANSNFGFNLPWWDRLLGTYREQPQDGHAEMTIGIEQFRNPRDLWLDRLLVQPWLGPAGGYPINRQRDISE